MRCEIWEDHNNDRIKERDVWKQKYITFQTFNEITRDSMKITKKQPLRE